MTGEDSPEGEREVLLAFFPEERQVQRVLDRLIEEDFPLDRISLLARSGGSGDDPLGVYYANGEGRVKGWGKLGAIWGGVLGGMVGLFVLPGVGPMMIAGPVIEALLGAGLGGALGAGGAALSEVSLAIHRMGVPARRLEETEQYIRSGHYVLLLILDKHEGEKWEVFIDRFSPRQRWRYPFLGVREALDRLF